MASQFPAILITGARQVGKTSILRRVFPHASYVTLDYPGYAEAAETAPDEFLDRFAAPVIIDEIQYAPSLLRHIKVRIDRDRRSGMYLLTGSQAFPLMEGVSESLAGRCGVLNLQTLSRSEILASQPSLKEAELVWLGGYPELYVGADSELWFPSYVATYLERDVRNVLRVIDLRDFNRFIRVCALRNAQTVNYSDLARDTGIAPNTARKWLSLLEASGVIAMVEPFFKNRTKRLMKSPKLFFMDTGLAAFLAGFRSGDALFDSSHGGAFWESYVFGQLVRWFTAMGRKASIFTWRTVSGHEVDLVVEVGGEKVIAIECKWSQRPGRNDEAGLRSFVDTQQGEAASFVVCRTPAEFRLPGGAWVTDLPGLFKRIASE